MASTGTKDGDGKKTAKPSSGPVKSELLKRAEARAGKQGPITIDSIKQYFIEAKEELSKTSWPSREVLVKSTTVVLSLVFASAVYVGIIDLVLTKVFSLVNGPR